MSSDLDGGVPSLAGRQPRVTTERLLADLVPPRHFEAARFDTYRPDPSHPSQAAARDRLRALAVALTAPPRRVLRRHRPAPPACYLDGGFGVGKTHLLAAFAHAVGPGRAAYGTFLEYTHLVGALGFGATVRALAGKQLVCIDEFELDDPGDTVLMSRLLRELTDAGVALAATSNTPPEALGAGRFAAEDFRREIQHLADRFEVLRIDGEDYRRRRLVTAAEPVPDAVLRAAVAGRADATYDHFDALLAHLATVHPSRYGALVDGVGLAAVAGVGPVADQFAALRLVVLVDRLYDRDVPVLLGGAGEAGLFSAEMLRGGYRAKYFRALSRLGALAQVGRTATPGDGAPGMVPAPR